MRLARVRNFCGLLATAVCLAAAPSAALASPYDGQWTVTIVTHAGDCQPSASYPVMVVDGKVTAAGGDISGKVNPNGVVRVSLQGAHANGTLSGNSGTGKWNGASAGVACSGRWQASRN